MDTDPSISCQSAGLLGRSLFPVRPPTKSKQWPRQRTGHLQLQFAQFSEHLCVSIVAKSMQKAEAAAVFGNSTHSSGPNAFVLYLALHYWTLAL